jgi:hypothetical protein
VTQQAAASATPPTSLNEPVVRPAANDPDSGPIKIRAYGLLPLTKTAYLRVQVVAFAVFLLALIASLLVPPPAGLREYRIFEFTPLIVAALGVLEGIEMLLMLRKFKAKESERESVKLNTPNDT